MRAVVLAVALDLDLDLELVLVLAACLVLAMLPWAAMRSAGRSRGLRAGVGGFGSVAGVVGFGWVGSGRRAGRQRGLDRDALPRCDVLDLLDLVDAAIAAGVALPRALGAVGAASGGDTGQALVRASSALVMGAEWHAAWQGAPARLGPVISGLGPTWKTGAAPGPALRASAERLSRERRSREREAAGRLGVLLVLPLGLCFLPAFVLIGLVPVLISLGSGLFA